MLSELSTPPSLETRDGGVLCQHPPSIPLPRSKCEFPLSTRHHTPPSRISSTGGGVSFVNIIHVTTPLPRSKCETEGVFPLFTRHHTPPSLERETEGIFSLSTPQTPPSHTSPHPSLASTRHHTPPSLERETEGVVKNPRGALTRQNGSGSTRVYNPCVRGGLTAGTGPGDAETPRGSPVEFPRSQLSTTTK